MISLNATEKQILGLVFASRGIYPSQIKANLPSGCQPDIEGCVDRLFAEELIDSLGGKLWLTIKGRKLAAKIGLKEERA